MDETASIRCADDEFLFLVVVAQEGKGVVHLQPVIELRLLRRQFRYLIQSFNDSGHLQYAAGSGRS